MCVIHKGENKLYSFQDTGSNHSKLPEVLENAHKHKPLQLSYHLQKNK